MAPGAPKPTAYGAVRFPTSRRAWRGALLLAVASLTSGCAGQVTPPPPMAPPAQPGPTTPAPPVNARAAGVSAGPPVAELPIDAAGAARALAAFRLSCPVLLRRDDGSGLTRRGDWAAPCAAAVADEANAQDFFVKWFETVRVGDGKAFVTGYFEPEIAGSLERADGYTVPVHGPPDDLIEADLGDFSDTLKGKRLRGRVEGGKFVPYFDRAAIDAGAIDSHAPVIAWAADPIDLFFLEIQGSGRLRLPDGQTLRIGYAGQNGRDYTAIGAVMRARGLLPAGGASLQGITAWLRAHPAEAPEILHANKSYVFFRKLSGPPVGALNVAVSARASAAADPKFVPLGAPVMLMLDRGEANGLWIAQDTGGAIRGANRFDSFWGAGEEARAVAGGLAAHGSALVLLPKGTLARIASEGGDGTAAAER